MSLNKDTRLESNETNLEQSLWEKNKAQTLVNFK